MDTLTSRTNILGDFISNSTGQMSTAQCFHVEQQNASSMIDQEKSYKDDNDNFRIIHHLRKHKADDWSPTV